MFYNVKIVIIFQPFLLSTIQNNNTIKNKKKQLKKIKNMNNNFLNVHNTNIRLILVEIRVI